MTPTVDLRFGDCLAVLRELPDESVQAARDEGFASIGIERDEFAYRLARQRLDAPAPPVPAEAAPEEPADVVQLPGQVDLFDLLDGEAS